MSDTQHTPTDSEMLDWLIRKQAVINFRSQMTNEDRANGGKVWLSYMNHNVSGMHQTPRAAIAAAMEKEAQ